MFIVESDVERNRRFLSISGVTCKRNRVFFTRQGERVKEIAFSLFVWSDVYKKWRFLYTSDIAQTSQLITCVIFRPLCIDGG